jgi:hypothetical protein
VARTRLECLSPESAQAVAVEADLPGTGQRATAEGPVVVLDYFDKRYALDVAEWAFNAGHASDRAAADMVAGL